MKLRVFTSFSGYDSQLMGLRDIGADYECVGWSEIDKWAIKAHDAVFPELAGRNYGDITKIARRGSRDVKEGRVDPKMLFGSIDVNGDKAIVIAEFQRYLEKVYNVSSGSKLPINVNEESVTSHYLVRDVPFAGSARSTRTTGRHAWASPTTWPATSRWCCSAASAAATTATCTTTWAWSR